jgi:hypothetical protein
VAVRPCRFEDEERIGHDAAHPVETEGRTAEHEGGEPGHRRPAEETADAPDEQDCEKPSEEGW